MHFKHHKDKWWTDPIVRKPQVKIPRRIRETDPLTSDWTPPSKSRIGAFAHSRQWCRFVDLDRIDAGYITPLYSLHAIGKRYGLSDNGERYFRKNILPEPYKVLRIRSVTAHHWSHFTLMALDVVLRDLEKKGIHQFLARYQDHIELLHKGNDFLHSYYAHVYDTKAVQSGDRFGVEWL